MRGDVKSPPTGVQKGTCKSSHGSILNVEVEGDCGGCNQRRCCSVGMFRPARWCRILSINSPQKRVLGNVTNERKNETERKRDGMVARQNMHGNRMAGWQDKNIHEHAWAIGEQKW